MIGFDRTTIASGDDVRAFVARAFGGDLATDAGTIHTAAIWDGPHGPRVIAIGPHAPASQTDSFLLHLSRARADVILTTGKILRNEPTLAHDLGVAAGFADALLDYRKRHVGKPKRARVVVLTSGDIDFTHRALHGWAEPWVFVPATARRELDERASMHGVKLVRFPVLDLESALSALADDGATTISIEAGISTTSSRYANGWGFDELVLSRYVEPSIDSRAIGSAFPERAELERIYGAPTAQFDVTEPSGAWSVERYRNEKQIV